MKKNYFPRFNEIGASCLIMVALATSTLPFAQENINVGLKLHYTF